MNWDQITTNLGNSLIGMQQPFGMPQPVDPAQRQQMIAQSLMTLGGNISANKKNPAAGLGAGVSQLKAQGLDEMGRMAYFQQVQDTATERKAKKEALNQTREWARKHPAFKDMPVDSMDGEDLIKYYVDSQKPQDAPNWQTVTTADGVMAFNPETRQMEKIGDVPPKEGQARRTQKTTVAGNDVLMDLDTGEIITDYGKTQSRAQTVPTAIQTDIIKAETAVKGINSALDDYEKMVKNDVGTWTGTFGGAGKDALGQSRTNISMMLKEAYALGVLNGPDYMLMQQMLFDPRLEALDPIGNASKVYSSITGGTGERAGASVAKLKEILNNSLDAKRKVVSQYGGGENGAMSPEAPADVDPAIWEEMTPEEKSAWTSQ
jgi:hypothetical protein